MYAINKTPPAKGMLQLWRFQPNNLMTKVGKSFAAKTRQAMIYSKHIATKRQAG